MRAYPELTARARTRRLRALAKRALPLWGLTGRLKLLRDAFNAIFRLDTDDGRRLVVRVRRGDFRHPDEVGSELAWLAQLARAGIDWTPAPVAALDGALHQVVRDPGMPKPRAVSVLTWVPGRVLAGSVSADSMYRFGARAAALHRWRFGQRVVVPGKPTCLVHSRPTFIVCRGGPVQSIQSDRKALVAIMALASIVFAGACGTKPLDDSPDPDSGSEQVDTGSDDAEAQSPADSNAVDSGSVTDAGAAAADTSTLAPDSSAADTGSTAGDTSANAICAACVAPFPGCAEVQGKWLCVQCSKDAHCASGTCDLSTNTCAVIDAGPVDSGATVVDTGPGSADVAVPDAGGSAPDAGSVQDAGQVTDTGPTTDPACAACKAPFAACAKLNNGIWACVECINDGDCAKLKKGTCSLTTNSCSPASTSGGSSSSGSSGASSGSSSGAPKPCLGCPCKKDLDCKGKCGDKAKDCTCGKGPTGDVCVAGCFFAADCPPDKSGSKQICSAQGYCIAIPGSGSSGGSSSGSSTSSGSSGGSGGSSSSGGPTKCKSSADCKGQCGPVKICTCAFLASGPECAPGCKVSTDCPTFSNGIQGFCTKDGYCVPVGGPGSSSGGSGSSSGQGGSSGGGSSGGGKPGPKCTSDKDCAGKGKCIDNTKFCGCRTIPGEGAQCVATCKADADCPSTPDGKKKGKCNQGGICGYK